jgi:hypothetical protein
MRTPLILHRLPPLRQVEKAANVAIGDVGLSERRYFEGLHNFDRVPNNREDSGRHENSRRKPVNESDD